jgi:AcrR family transcriptional regulator
MSSAPQRLSRKEQQARTRGHLIQAAGRVFARRGLHQASVEQIAAEAGYTKGALYANFASKEDLFLALLEERFADRIEALDAELARPGSPEDHARAGGADFIAYLQRDAEWERLFFEFAAHAARDDTFRGELLERWNALIERMASLIERYGERAGVVPPGSVAYFALMIFTMANGVALQRTIDPDVPDALLPDMLELLTLGVLAKAAQSPG